jgi:hypothetical protein
MTPPTRFATSGFRSDGIHEGIVWDDEGGRQAVGRIVRKSDDYTRRSGAEPPKPAQERIILRACIAAGAPRQIRYADVRETASISRPTAAPAPAAARAAPKHGRNDPLPLRQRAEV